MLPGWKRKLMYRLRASCCTGSRWIRAGAGAYPPRSAVWRGFFVIAFARIHVGEAGGIAGRITFESTDYDLNDSCSEAVVTRGFAGY